MHLVTPEDLDANIEILRGAGIVLTQLEIPTETVQYLATICERDGVPLILDPAPAKQLPKGLLDKVDWFTPNETEATFFIGNGAAKLHDPAEMAQTLLAKGVRGVVLKLGSRGAYLASADGLGARLEPFRVHAVDTRLRETLSMVRSRRLC
jgi:ribokinase